MSIKKIIGKLHLWLGLSSGLVIFILAITGCIFCFQKELKDIFYTGRMFINSAIGQPLPLDSLKLTAQQALGNQYPITFIEYRPGSNKTVQFRASKINANALTYNGQVVYNKTVFVNPYTGRVQAIENTKWEFFNVVLQLHFSLLFNNIGHQVIGWSTVIFILMLIMGLILWWPKNKAAIKQRFKFDWQKTTQWKRKNYDLHNVPGFYSLMFALLIALTGLFFAFPWFNNSVRWIANGGKTMQQPPTLKSDTTQMAATGLLNNMLQTTNNHSPKAQFYFISMPLKSETPYVVTAMHNAKNYLKRSQFFYDRNTGKLLRERPYQKQTGAEKFVFMVYDIHIGKIGGLPGQILVFIVSLIAASLPVTGFYIWWGRQTQKKPPAARQASGHKAARQKKILAAP